MRRSAKEEGGRKLEEIWTPAEVAPAPHKTLRHGITYTFHTPSVRSFWQKTGDRQYNLGARRENGPEKEKGRGEGKG